MAFRRIIFTGDKISGLKENVQNFFELDKFKNDFPGVKSTVKDGAKPNVLVVDVNGDGADSVSKKLKDIGNKWKVETKIRNEIKLSPIKEDVKLTSNPPTTPITFVSDEERREYEDYMEKRENEKNNKDVLKENHIKASQLKQLIKEELNNVLKEAKKRFVSRPSIITMSEPELWELPNIKGTLNGEPGYFKNFSKRYDEVYADFYPSKNTPSGMKQVTRANKILQNNVTIEPTQI